MPTSTATVDTSGLGRIIKRLAKLKSPDASPLMFTWCLIIDEDNKKGVLAGTDKDGVPMRPVTYRPVKDATGRLTKAQKNNPAKGARRGIYRGLGASPAGLNNNLTAAEYRRLKGPPLAPRGAFSRVITQLVLTFGMININGKWSAHGYWNEVLSAKGVAFLKFHFNGIKPMPRRDLRGVRPWGKEKAARAAKAWMIDLIRRGDQ